MHVTYNVPKQCLSTPCGLIVDVHGLTMNGEIEDANTNMRALGEQHGYIVAQPTASPDVVPLNHWGEHAEEAIVGFVDLALAEPSWKIDRNRVHHMGFSEGASLTWDMHARHADLFASVVAMEYGRTQFSSNMTQIPMLYQNGKLDPNWPVIAKQTVKAITAAWDLNAGTTLAKDNTFTHTRYVSNQGVHFDFLVHEYVADYAGLGHCFPGSNDTALINHTSGEVPLVGPFGCPGVVSKKRASYFIGAKAMEFFIEHPKQGTIAV